MPSITDPMRVHWKWEIKIFCSSYDGKLWCVTCPALFVAPSWKAKIFENGVLWLLHFKAYTWTLEWRGVHKSLKQIAQRTRIFTPHTFTHQNLEHLCWTHSCNYGIRLMYTLSIVRPKVTATPLDFPIKGRIGYTFTVLTYKMNMTCYQILRNRLSWSTGSSHCNTTASATHHYLNSLIR